MKFERLLLTLSGMAGIAAFFMPFFRLKKFILELSISGYTYVEAGLDMAGYGKHAPARELVNLMWESVSQASSFQKGVLFVGLSFILLGPIFFALHSLGHFIRGIAGLQYKRGIFFVLLYMAGSWAFLKYYGSQVNMNVNFFSLVDYGFWVAFGAIIVAAFSMFFETNNSK